MDWWNKLATTWDVVVVGAGPAGSAAAIGASRVGLRVLQVDAKPFPRRKPCGGCLNQATLQFLCDLLPADDPIWSAGRQLSRFHLSHRRQSFCFPMPEGRAVDRAELDMSLVRAAQASGVTFLAPATAHIEAGFPRGATSHQVRYISLRNGSDLTRIAARVVVVATGLGGASCLPETDDRPTHIARSSRVGVETVQRCESRFYERHTLYMAVADEGYVGIAPAKGGALHVAAAVDREVLRRLGPASLVRRILADAGMPPWSEGDGENWRGTRALTSRPRRLAAERIFLVGDAAGYVEPFTGEGIRWALESGRGVVPFLESAQSTWDGRLIAKWKSWYRHHIISQQRICLALAWGLRRRTARWIAHQTLNLHPVIASSLIARLNKAS